MITFQNIGQYLVVSKESNDQVSSRLDAATMDIHKFRPKIIVSGAPAPHDENFWSQVIFPGNLKMEFGADKGWKHGPVFNEYSYTALKDIGRSIRVDDRAVVTKRVKEQRVFYWPLPKAAIAAFSG
ncbi:hypothetical protein AC579_10572 [Pseudocercospora musae]|uniref:MOSC domain-containing protein n=1 Tax=Pseudocercospora musae TaxID=113226 RepID=A0A139GZK9_9PEZI|nr:hypothetical protein AC579_10572 [Pseudocercospora musae]